MEKMETIGKDGTHNKKTNERNFFAQEDTSNDLK